MQEEPGKPGFTRLAVSLKPEDDAKLERLRTHFNNKSGRRHSLAAIVREAVDCLANREGV